MVEVFSENTEGKAGEFTIAPPYLITFDDNLNEVYTDLNGKLIKYKGTCKVIAKNIVNGKEFSMNIPHRLSAIKPADFDKHLEEQLKDVETVKNATPGQACAFAKNLESQIKHAEKSKKSLRCNEKNMDSEFVCSGANQGKCMVKEDTGLLGQPVKNYYCQCNDGFKGRKCAMPDNSYQKIKEQSDYIKENLSS